MSRLSAKMMAAVFAVFIGLPPTLFIFGVSAATIENRAQSEVALPEVGSIVDGTWFERLDQALIDRLPLRPQAIRADAWLDLNVLGDSPSPQVVVGSEAWLYLAESLQQPCLSRRDVRRFAEEVRRATDIARAAGKDFRLLIAPDKASIIPQFAPADSGVICVLQNADNLKRLHLGSLVTPWNAIERAIGGGKLYVKWNTHWTTRAAGFAGRQLVDSLASDLWKAKEFKRIKREMFEGDLTRILGLPKSEPVAVFTARREGVPTYGPVRGAVRFPSGGKVPGLRWVRFRTPAPAPTVRGSTVVLHDSFGFALRNALLPYFEEVTFVRMPDLAQGYLAPYIRSASTVIVESVQRAAFQRVVEDPLGEVMATALWKLLPRSGVRASVGSEGFRVPRAANAPLRYALVERGGKTATFAVRGREIILDSKEPRRAILVPVGGVKIRPREGRIHVRVVDVPR